MELQPKNAMEKALQERGDGLSDLLDGAGQNVQKKSTDYAIDDAQKYV